MTKNYQQGHGFFWYFMFFILLVTVIFLVLYYFNFFNFRTYVKEKLDVINIFKKKPVVEQQGTQVAVIKVIPPPTELTWCRVQDMPVSPSALEPQSMSIIGYDDLNSVCVLEVKGIHQCLNRTAILDYGFSSNIGGAVVWATLDGYFIPLPTDYKKNIKKMYKEGLNDLSGCECVSHPAIYDSQWLLPEVIHSCN